MYNHKRLKLVLLLTTAASPAIAQFQEGATVGNEPSQILQLNKLQRLDNNQFLLLKIACWFVYSSYEPWGNNPGTGSTVAALRATP